MNVSETLPELSTSLPISFDVTLEVGEDLRRGL
jgi:hypothetical protein